MSRLSSLLAPVQKIQLIHFFLSIDVSSAPPAPAAPSLWSGPKAASPACSLPAWVLDGGAGPGKQCWGLSSRAGRSSPPHFLFFNQYTPGDREEAVNSGGDCPLSVSQGPAACWHPTLPSRPISSYTPPQLCWAHLPRLCLRKPQNTLPPAPHRGSTPHRRSSSHRGKQLLTGGATPRRGNTSHRGSTSPQGEQFGGSPTGPVGPTGRAQPLPLVANPQLLWKEVDLMTVRYRKAVNHQRKTTGVERPAVAAAGTRTLLSNKETLRQKCLLVDTGTQIMCPLVLCASHVM